MEHIHGSYDGELVAFSYIVAVLASYTVLDLAGRVSQSRGRSRWNWILFGAIAMGMGIWSMHFVGMLAFSLPVPVAYDLVIVFVSVLTAVLASFVALYIVGRDQVTVRRLLGGGILFAAGISTMHYVGMDAMLIDISYDPFYFSLSIVIAVVASIAALWLAFYFRKGGEGGHVWKKLGSGLIMGAAITGMHYTGMKAANFHLGGIMSSASGIVLDQKLLAYVISGATFFTLGLSLFGIFIAKRFARKETELQENEKWYKSLYENNQDGIMTVDLHRRIVDFNVAAARITGGDPRQYLNQPVSSILPLIVEEERERTREFFLRTFSGETHRYETAIINQAGGRVDLTVINVPVVVEGQVVGNYVIARDVTDEKRTKEKIRHQAFHDELTGLPNRRRFNQELEQMIEANQHSAVRFAVLVMDIDRFKMINDSLGHMYGDIFLQEVSRRIIQSVEGHDVLLARIGGDEFTLLCRHCARDEEAAVLAERIIAAIKQPYRLKENDFYVTASIGIAVYPEHGQDSSQLVKNADMAMYEVKKNGKNGFQFFTSQLNDHLQEKVQLESDLKKAIECNEFMLYYQPQIRAEDGQMIGVEALVRWNHPVKGVLSPGVFIPIAEELGVIEELGSWVLREACNQMKLWHERGGPLISVSVNLSSQQFHQANLVETIKQILEDTGLESRYLELEITESMMMDASVSTSILNELTALDIRISLDDFGTGYSSLSYLKMFPIHKLKIDRSFIRDIVVNKSDKAIVDTIISMAQNLNLEVIAEGIETKDQLDILLSSQCQEIQGYYFSKPLSANDVEKAFFDPLRVG